METEFRVEYNVSVNPQLSQPSKRLPFQEMRKQCQEFATALLDHARTSHELEIMLNFNGSEVDEYWEPGERQTLERLKLAIRYKQKKVEWQSFSLSDWQVLQSN